MKQMDKTGRKNTDIVSVKSGRPNPRTYNMGN